MNRKSFKTMRRLVTKPKFTEDFIDQEEVVQSYVNESSILSSVKKLLFGNDESEYDTDDTDDTVIIDAGTSASASASASTIPPIITRKPKMVSILIFAHGTLINTPNQLCNFEQSCVTRYIVPFGSFSFYSPNVGKDAINTITQSPMPANPTKQEFIEYMDDLTDDVTMNVYKQQNVKQPIDIERTKRVESHRQINKIYGFYNEPVIQDNVNPGLLEYVTEPDGTKYIRIRENLSNGKYTYRKCEIIGTHANGTHKIQIIMPDVDFGVFMLHNNFASFGLKSNVGMNLLGIFKDTRIKRDLQSIVDSLNSLMVKIGLGVFGPDDMLYIIDPTCNDALYVDQNDSKSKDRYMRSASRHYQELVENIDNNDRVNRWMASNYAFLTRRGGKKPSRKTRKNKRKGK